MHRKPQPREDPRGYPPKHRYISPRVENSFLVPNTRRTQYQRTRPPLSHIFSRLFRSGNEEPAISFPQKSPSFRLVFLFLIDHSFDAFLFSDFSQTFFRKRKRIRIKK
ncbi:hypothetical protein ABW19_dt0202706 [Dactylella cylindrospora]|nr:hypothetical protein ABW19_dt0202706 [Dactylella cylindrospora]